MKPQLGRQILLEEILYLLDTLLCLVSVEQGLIAYRLNKFAHIFVM